MAPGNLAYFYTLRFGLFLNLVFGFQILCCGQEVIRYENARATLVNNVLISTLEPGVVDQVHFKNGDSVTENQLLVQLNSNSYQSDANIAKLEEEVSKIRAADQLEIEIASKTETLNKKLFERSQSAFNTYPKSISQSEVDRLQAQSEQSKLLRMQATKESEINQILANLESEQAKHAAIKLFNRGVRAPLDGLIQEVFVQRGEWVDSGQPIVRIINLDRLRINAFFSARHRTRISKDSVAYFEYLEDDQLKRVPARITFIGSEIEPETQDFSVWAEIENVDRMVLPGVKGTFSIEISNAP